MNNILRILKRDTLRLLKAPAALIVVGALMVLPSLYTWYNVAAFWNPYEATGQLRVSVVNQDQGTKTDLTGALNVGDKITEELLANDKLHFVEQSADDAMADLEVGKVFAVYVIPEDFSQCLVSPLTGHIKQPQITYYANEKLGPVSPKITDTAASTLEQTVNSMFVATVSEAAAQAIGDAIKDAEAAIAAAQSKTTASMSDANAALTDVRSKLTNAQLALDNARAKTGTITTSLDNAQTLMSDARTLVNDVSTETTAVQNSLNSLSSSTAESLSGVASELSQVASKAGTAANSLLADAGSARALVDLGGGRVQALAEALSEAARDLQTAAADLPDDDPTKAPLLDAANNLSGKAAELQSAADAASALSADIETVAQTAADAAGALDGAAKQVSDALANYSGGLIGSASPTISSILSRINSSCSLLSTATSDLETTMQTARTSLTQLDSLLLRCNDALAQTDSLVGGLQTDANSIASDLRLLAQSDTITELVKNGSLNAQNIGAFMGSPTKLETVRLYHPNAYGTSMAPLFMNLTLWIGAFMLVIIFRLEVDAEGIKRITLAQRYISRFVLLAGISVVQAIICCAGVLALGVQVANAPALFFSSAVASLAYFSIIYALSKTLHHIGKALCIILVFAQIPGGSGLYPLELTDSFFQAVYPFLPFSYGISAMREAIGGFYGNYFAHDIMVLAAIFVCMIVLGVVLGPLMSNVTRMAACQIREGDLYNGEDAVVPERPYRISQVVGAISDKDEFREKLERRYTRFIGLYPKFIRAAIALAIGVPAILALVLALDAGERVVLLTIVVVWLVALLVFVLIVESLRNSFERQLNLEHLSGDGALNILVSREKLVPALAGVTQRMTQLGRDDVPKKQSYRAQAHNIGDIPAVKPRFVTPDVSPGEAYARPIEGDHARANVQQADASEASPHGAHALTSEPQTDIDEQTPRGAHVRSSEPQTSTNAAAPSQKSQTEVDSDE